MYTDSITTAFQEKQPDSDKLYQKLPVYSEESQVL